MQKNPPKIRAIIFDLDDTLYDCSGTLVLRGRRQAAGKIARLINCSEEEAYSLQLEMDEKFGVNTNIYEKIVTHYSLSRCNGYPDSVEGTGLQDGSGHLRG